MLQDPQSGGEPVTVSARTGTSFFGDKRAQEGATSLEFRVSFKQINERLFSGSRAALLRAVHAATQDYVYRQKAVSCCHTTLPNQVPKRQQRTNMCNLLSPYLRYARVPKPLRSPQGRAGEINNS